MQGYNIIKFAQVEVDEVWLDSQDQIVSPEEAEPNASDQSDQPTENQPNEIDEQQNLGQKNSIEHIPENEQSELKNQHPQACTNPASDSVNPVAEVAAIGPSTGSLKPTSDTTNTSALIVKVATNDLAKTAIGTNDVQVSGLAPTISGQQTSDSSSVIALPVAASRAVPVTTAEKAEIAYKKNPEDCASCSKHFTPTTLSRLLESTVTGKLILERAAQGPLSKDSQKDLVAIIADYHCSRGAETTESILGEYVNSVTSFFKGECKVFR